MASDGSEQSVIDPAVLALLRCPRTGRPLRVVNHQGRVALQTDDGSVLHEVRDGILILLPDAKASSPSPGASATPPAP